MTERFRLKVGVTRQKTCQSCPMSELHFKNKTDEGSTIYDAGTLVCRIAALERKLQRVPIYSEVEDSLRVLGRYHFEIPNDCPNEYLNYSNLPTSKRKK